MDLRKEEVERALAEALTEANALTEEGEIGITRNQGVPRIPEDHDEESEGRDDTDDF